MDGDSRYCHLNRHSMDIRHFSDNSLVLIDAEEIDDSPGPFSMSFGFDLKPLIRSIERYGLINRPFLTIDNTGKRVPVIGFRRILALKSLQWRKIPCVDLSDSGLSVLDLILLNLHDNLTKREFNDVEKGMILCRLVPHVTRNEILKHYMPLLNLRSHESSLELFLKIENLEIAIKHSIADGTVSMKAIGKILDWDNQSRKNVFTWFKNIKFNFNQQIQFTEYITDISIKEKKSIAHILDEKEMIEILEDNKLNNPQKAKRVLHHLRSRRLPLLTQSEENFQKNLSRLNLPKGVRIQHPPFFESPDYRLEIVFRNGKELKEKIDDLAKLGHFGMIEDPDEKDFS